MNQSILEKWQNTLEVIRFEKEKQLAVINYAEIIFSCSAIQPNAQFLFQQITNLLMEIEISTTRASLVDAVTSTNNSTDLFGALHSMPNLLRLVLFLDKSVKRVDHFTPLLQKLRSFSLHIYGFVELAPTAFDHLDRLLEFSIENIGEKKMCTFETGLVACSLRCSGLQLLKLNNAKEVMGINEISTCGMIESTPSLSRLDTLTFRKFNPEKTINLPIFFRQFTNISNLKLNLREISQVDRGQLSCLVKLKTLTCTRESTVTATST
jgi:hypothetical protein